MSYSTLSPQPGDQIGDLLGKILQATLNGGGYVSTAPTSPTSPGSAGNYAVANGKLYFYDSTTSQWYYIAGTLV